MSVFKLLECPLNPEEVLANSHKLAEASLDKIRVEAEKKEANAEFGSQLKDLSKEIERLSKAMQDGFEEREVECDYRKNPEAGVMETIRLDTMAVIDSRPLEGNELNETMDFDGKQPGETEGEENE